MYTAQLLDTGIFHITLNGNGKMRAKSKVGIINLIMSNRWSAYLLSIMDHVTITYEDSNKFVEMKVTKCDGLIYIKDAVSVMVI